MTFHRTRYVLLLSVVAICLGCQPDQRPADWRVDGGMDADHDDGGWRKLPAPAGGGVFGKVDGQLLAHRKTDDGHEVSSFSMDGRVWHSKGKSEIASKLTNVNAPSFAETSRGRYLVVWDGWESPRRFYHAPPDEDGFKKVSAIGGLDGLQNIYQVQGRLVASTEGGLHLRSGPDTWENVEPLPAYGGSVAQKNVEVVGGTLITWSDATDGTFVSSDRGESWTRPSVQDDMGVSLVSAASAAGDLYMLTYPGDGQRLVHSADGLSWTSKSVESSVPLRHGTLTGMEGDLYVLDERLRLVRISTDSGETEILTAPEFDASSSIRHPDLYSTGSTLVMSLTAGRGGDAVLSWRPGEATWTLESVARKTTYWMEVVDGELLARGGVYQAFSESAGRWTRTTIPNEMSFYSVRDRLVGVSDAEDCLYLKDTEGWQREVQWTTAGVTIGCDQEQTTGQIVDVDEFRNGYVLARARDYGSGPDAPPGTNQGGLVYWNPTTDEVEFLASEALQSDGAPNVRAVTSTDGQLWVRTIARSRSDDTTRFHRYSDGEWTTLQPDLITLDGQRLGPEKATVSLSYRMEGYGSTLMAIVSWEDSSGEWLKRFGRWNRDKQAFELAPELPSAVEFREFTERGPIAAAGEGIWHFNVGAAEWRQIGPAFPVDASEVIEFATDGTSVYAATEAGPIYATEFDGVEPRD